MKTAILDLTRHPLPLLSGIRRAGECIEDWLSQGFSDTKFEIFDIAGGIDQVPSMRNFDALVVSGSERSVYDDISWYVDVSDTLNESRKMGKPPGTGANGPISGILWRSCLTNAQMRG